MPRVDVWDVIKETQEEDINCGYPRNLEEVYTWGVTLGQGGFGLVRVVRSKATGKEYACKSIAKKLDLPNISPQRQQQHLENITREVAVLRKLRGTLNVVHMEHVYEDVKYVHIVMEYCRGGELLHRIGQQYYTEGTVKSYMRAVLRTLAQCHAHKILHRDIKPGNFMLLNSSEDSPLKAIDFGLAVFFDPKKLPRTDLGLEGTPWYMAPETLSSRTEPASDVWSAGVMAYQLLSGRFPFNDRSNPESPALSKVWKSILADEPNFSKSYWSEISDEGKDFCRQLLNKDPSLRPTARQALEHPWLKGGKMTQRRQGKQLGATVVQRLQRYGQVNAFKRGVLDMIANELIRSALSQGLGGSLRGGASAKEALRDASLHGSLKGGMSAKAMLEARKALAPCTESISPNFTSGPSPLLAGAHDAPQTLQAPDSVPEGAPSASPGPGLHGGDGPVLKGAMNTGDSGYRGPVKDPVASAHWDLQQMNRLVEGSGHSMPFYNNRFSSSFHEGTWHGPSNVNLARVVALDRSWHGRKSGEHERSKTGPEGGPGAERPGTESYYKFLEAARKARWEQKKAARLALDTSVHGGRAGLSTASPSRSLSTGSNSSKGSITAKVKGVLDKVFGGGEKGPRKGDPGKGASEPKDPLKRVSWRSASKDSGSEAEDVEINALTRASSSVMEIISGSQDKKPQGVPPGPGVPIIREVGNDSAMAAADHHEEIGGRGRGGYKALMASQGAELKPLPPRTPTTNLGQMPTPFQTASTLASRVHSAPAGVPLVNNGDLKEGRGAGCPESLHFSGNLSDAKGDPLQGPSGAKCLDGRMTPLEQAMNGSPKVPLPLSSSAAIPMTDIRVLPTPSQPDLGVPLGEEVCSSSRPQVSFLSTYLLSDPEFLTELRMVLRRLDYGGRERKQEVPVSSIAEGLQALGYDLAPSEVDDLMRLVTIGDDGSVALSEFVASQIDWESLQKNHYEEWLRCLKRTFEELDRDKNGVIQAEDMIRLLKDKLPEQEVNLAVEDALIDACALEEGEMDFDTFVEMFRQPSSESLMSLDQFDSRMRPRESMELVLGDLSLHGAEGFRLQPLPDDE